MCVATALGHPVRKEPTCSRTETGIKTGQGGAQGNYSAVRNGGTGPLAAVRVELGSAELGGVSTEASPMGASKKRRKGEQASGLSSAGRGLGVSRGFWGFQGEPRDSGEREESR